MTRRAAGVVALATRGSSGVTDARLAIPALVGWLAAVVLIGIPGIATAVALAAVVVVALALAIGSARRRAGRGFSAVAASIPSLIAVVVVAAAVALAAPARVPVAVAGALAEGSAVSVIVELQQTVNPPTTRASSGSRSPTWGASADALIFVVGTHRAGGAAPATSPAPTVASSSSVRVPVRVLGIEASERLPLGTRLEGRVRLIALDAGDNRVALVRPLTPLTVVSSPAPLIAGADRLRAGFLELMQPFAGDGGDLLPGLAIGDTTAVSDDLDRAMKASALSHLTAVSGANCAIVVGLVLVVGAFARWPRPVRVGVALAVLAGFVVLVTPEPSVVRASVMAAVVLFALASGRPSRGLPVLGIAVVGIIVLDPWIAREYGFVLSVLATAALLVLAAPLATLLSRVLPAPLALAIAVPLAAQIACQPVLILLAPEVPLVGVIANVLAAPAAPVATIVGMIACLLAPIVPPLAIVVAGLAWLPSAWIAGVARVTSELPGALLPWPGGPAGALLLGALIAAALVAAGIPARLGTVLLRRRLARGLAAALVVILASTAGVAAVRGLSRPSAWSIAQCDVGQGDAVLVRDAEQVALIDTGADEELLTDCLDTLNIDHIDVLVLTHFDLDHVGAVDVVIGRVDRVIVGPTGRPQDDAVVEALLAGGANVDVVSAGAEGMLGACSWRVLWPANHRGVDPGNDASLVLEWRGTGPEPSCPSMLALGDLGEQTQRMLAGAARPSLRPVEVVKVSHHGSADQHLELYRALAAPVALIGVGADNGYGHPAATILDELTALGTTIGRSDAHGLVLIERDENGLRVWRERDTSVTPAN